MASLDTIARPRAVSAAAGAWLPGVALVLLPLDIGLYLLSRSPPRVLPFGSHARHYFYLLLASDTLRLAVPVLVLLVLIRRGRIQRQDVGFTLGELWLTVRWMAIPAALAAGAWAIFGGTALLVMRVSGWHVPIEPT